MADWAILKATRRRDIVSFRHRSTSLFGIRYSGDYAERNRVKFNVFDPHARN